MSICFQNVHQGCFTAAPEAQEVDRGHSLKNRVTLKTSITRQDKMHVPSVVKAIPARLPTKSVTMPTVNTEKVVTTPSRFQPKLSYLNDVADMSGK